MGTRRRHTPEQIIRKLLDVDMLKELNRGNW
jgi:hypothetical protein